MGTEPHIITDEEFAFFKKKVYEFVERAGIYEWKIYCEKSKHSDKASGSVSQNYRQRKAYVNIAEKLYYLRYDSWEEEIIYIAAHEVGEVMMLQMDYMAQQHFASGVVEEYRHEVINHIVKLFLEKK